jgi:hypothetical protein
MKRRWLSLTLLVIGLLVSLSAAQAVLSGSPASPGPREVVPSAFTYPNGATATGLGWLEGHEGAALVLVIGVAMVVTAALLTFSRGSRKEAPPS